MTNVVWRYLGTAIDSAKIGKNSNGVASTQCKDWAGMISALGSELMCANLWGSYAPINVRPLPAVAVHPFGVSVSKDGGVSFQHFNDGKTAAVLRVTQSAGATLQCSASIGYGTPTPPTTSKQLSLAADIATPNSVELYGVCEGGSSAIRARRWKDQSGKVTPVDENGVLVRQFLPPVTAGVYTYAFEATTDGSTWISSNIVMVTVSSAGVAQPACTIAP